jgi:hypothetical protein
MVALPEFNLTPMRFYKRINDVLNCTGLKHFKHFKLQKRTTIHTCSHPHRQQLELKMITIYIDCWSVFHFHLQANVIFHGIISGVGSSVHFKLSTVPSHNKFDLLKNLPMWRKWLDHFNQRRKTYAETSCPTAQTSLAKNSVALTGI